MQEYKKVRDTILLQQDIDPDDRPLDILEYARHALPNGDMQEKREVVRALGGFLYIHDRSVCSALISQTVKNSYKNRVIFRRFIAVRISEEKSGSLASPIRLF